jgi:hypothetical protein
MLSYFPKLSVIFKIVTKTIEFIDNFDKYNWKLITKFIN